MDRMRPDLALDRNNSEPRRAGKAVRLADGDVTVSNIPDTGRQVWARVRARLRDEFGARTLDSWLSPLDYGAFDSARRVLCLSLPTPLLAPWGLHPSLDRPRKSLLEG